MWSKINKRIIRQGTVWSTADFRPKQEDIKQILALAGDEEIGIARLARPLLIFREGQFVGTGAWFRPEDLPEYCDNKDAQIAFVVKSFGDELFTTDAFAEILYADYFLRGKAYRSKTDINEWSSHQLEGYAPYDWRKYARTSGYNDLNRVALKRGWVEKVESKWRNLL